jgi:hypothetical protein
MLLESMSVVGRRSIKVCSQWGVQIEALVQWLRDIVGDIPTCTYGLAIRNPVVIVMHLTHSWTYII